MPIPSAIEQRILEALQHVPRSRWEGVLNFIISWRSTAKEPLLRSERPVTWPNPGWSEYGPTVRI